jgi:hypothetical protein
MSGRKRLYKNDAEKIRVWRTGVKRHELTTDLELSIKIDEYKTAHHMSKNSAIVSLIKLGLLK